MKILSFILAVLLLYSGSLSVAEAAYPMIYGVTQGSTYKEYVRIYWFDSNATATLSDDGGATKPSYTMGSQISSDGAYQIELTVTDGGESFTNVVDFQIDTNQTASLITHDDPALTGLSIEFVPGTYYNGWTQIMVMWLEDKSGNFLQNLYVSSTAATNYMRHQNSIKKRPHAVPYWAHKTCPTTTGEYGDTVYLADPATPLPEGLDGVSGATQKQGFKLKTHVVAPDSGSEVKVMFEINQSYDPGWYFASANPIAEETDEPSGTNFGNDVYFGTSCEPSLVYEVVVPLDQPGTYSTFDPVGYGHYGGRTGTLYTDFHYNPEDPDDPEGDYKFDHAPMMVDQITVVVHELPGDITGDFVVDLRDAVTGLKVCGGGNVPANINADVGDDERIDLKEVIYIMEQSVD